MCAQTPFTVIAALLSLAVVFCCDCIPRHTNTYTQTGIQIKTDHLGEFKSLASLFSHRCLGFRWKNAGNLKSNQIST